MSLRCLFGIHRYGNPSCLLSLGIWYVQCERCGRMMKVAVTERPEHCKVKDEPMLECRQDVCSCRARSAAPASRPRPGQGTDCQKGEHQCAFPECSCPSSTAAAPILRIDGAEWADRTIRFRTAEDAGKVMDAIQAAWQAPSTVAASAPDGYAVIMEVPKSQHPKGHWFVGVYHNEDVADDVAKKGDGSYRAVPVYFSPSSSIQAFPALAAAIKSTSAQEVADALDVAECCVHDQIKDPNEREHVYNGLKKVRLLAMGSLVPSATPRGSGDV